MVRCPERSVYDRHRQRSAYNYRLTTWVRPHDLVHEVQEFAAPAAGVVPGFHLAGHHIQRGEKRGGAVAFVAVAEAVNGAAIRQPQVPLRALQCLNARFLIDAPDHGVFRRVQIQRHHVGGLRAELRIGGDAPTAAALELNAAAAKNASNLVGADVAQRLGQQRAVPLRVTIRRRLIE